MTMLGATDVQNVKPGQTLDYRNAKLGLRTHHGKVGYCPKCGERGAIRINKAHPRGWKEDMVVVQHAATLVGGFLPHWTSRGDGDHHLVPFKEVEGEWDPRKAAS